MPGEALGSVERQFILAKCRLPWYVKSALLREPGGAKGSFNESFTSALNKSPSKCQRPLVFYPGLYDDNWETQWISKARIWMRDSKGISHGQPSNTFVGRQSQRSSLAVPSAPKSRAKNWNFGISWHSGIWLITAQMRISCLVKHQKKRCLMALSKRDVIGFNSV